MYLLVFSPKSLLVYQSICCIVLIVRLACVLIQHHDHDDDDGNGDDGDADAENKPPVHDGYSSLV